MRSFLVIFCLCWHLLSQAQSPDSLWQRSVRYYTDKNFHGMIGCMDTLLMLQPGMQEAYLSRGLARVSLGDMHGGCADLQRSENHDNKNMISFLCDAGFVREQLVDQFYKDETLYPELGYRPRYTAADTLRGSLGPERTCYDVYFYDLRVQIIPKGKKIKGSNTIYFTVKEPTRRIQADLFDQYQIQEITWAGKALPHTRRYQAIFIDFPQELKPGEKHTLTITYAGKPDEAPNPPWDGGFVWEHDKDGNHWIGVACEHFGASSWWPNKDHMSEKPDSMRITLEVPKGYQAISNGDLENTASDGKKTDSFTWFVDYPINNYNVTFYVGKYAAFSDTLIQFNDTLRLEYYVLPYNLETARKHFQQARDVLTFYNQAYGFYPFAEDGFGLVESPYEGMEHQTAIAYGSGYMQNNSGEYRNQIYDYIIVHEAAHEWWGNSVTAEDMADMWVHEGFATYSEYLFMEHRFGREEYLYELSDKSQYIFNIWPMVQNRGVNENTFASNDVYNKGAMMLHCLRCTINNDSLFFALVKGFYTENQYQPVNSHDFIDYVNAFTRENYTPFFNKYLYDTKIPVLEYRFDRQENDLVLRYRWTGVDEGFFMPFAIATDKHETFRLEGSTRWKETRLPHAEWFNFFNVWSGYEGCPWNGFTYYHTYNASGSGIDDR